MQTRKIGVEIKTIDEKHCSEDRCKVREDTDCVWFCEQFGEDLEFDNIGYLRTKQCIDNEIK